MTRYRNQHTARAAADPNFASEPDRACAGADPEIFFPGTNHCGIANVAKGLVVT